MTLFQNKYRIESIRLKNWDYSKNAAYFVTICTKNFIEHFGKIEESLVVLSEMGKIVKSEWEKTQIIREDVTLDEFIIMPNHFHGIILLKDSEDSRDFKKTNLTNVIKGFKSSVTSKIKKLGKEQFQWQSRYYDQIIRSERSLIIIRKYIMNNPLKWEIDEYNCTRNI